ncbi:flagellar FlaF family protein [Oceaniovalibus guishaninsula JLT2003]|uniref:Flagellar FlaF family protein n=1 Tax=Oceaniovalibus guishaninsula JLT2003 TaxID=1231392 RepID=K2HLK4_9RHOB|nr:flagellar biosynthesis regulator FlaF [Oceaniovalibus guishaninsula]EKE43784.1 flagellar FlaF family protein [Oceaniovalibus guishaninsula JLT2003]
MNASLLAQSAYGRASSALRTPQAVEYDVFARVTAALRRADDPIERIRALHDNRRLWQHLAVSVADSDNALPADLRARIFYLAEFTVQHTSKCMFEDASADVLVDINTAIMRGLQQERAAA